ncbi:unnamed protein product (mitochondrion) [Plasmodiophora brassicae]|uniref:PIPK domain-containing protein n=2 Tax=Plasmodiophora brassicae TaxID=37360 RepID=A0A3P3YK49_PLABS|nr:unnamed protein product [Plasmodiophora brassicae]
MSLSLPADCKVMEDPAAKPDEPAPAASVVAPDVLRRPSLGDAADPESAPPSQHRPSLKADRNGANSALVTPGPSHHIRSGSESPPASGAAPVHTSEGSNHSAPPPPVKDAQPIASDDIMFEFDSDPPAAASHGRVSSSDKRTRLVSGNGINVVLHRPETNDPPSDTEVERTEGEHRFPTEPADTPSSLKSFRQSRVSSRSPSLQSSARHSRGKLSRQVSNLLMKITPKKGVSIADRSHPEFELTCDMMLGIRHTAGRALPSDDTPITAEHFKQTFSYSFPQGGSSSTPAHNLPSFKFKDYQPVVYRSLRRRFGIDTADYLLCLCGDEPYLEFIANSKSGQFFFYSHDRRFMIKTITNSEAKFLQRILPQYHDYVMANRNTLLTAFLGMHRVKPHKMKKMHFIIMGSVFFTDLFINEVYDIKGSTLGRKATTREKEQETPVLKDLDFIENSQMINIGPELGAKFIKQLQEDARFLKKLRIMDYSLLIGIHRIESPDALGNVNADDSRHRRKQSNYGLKTWHQVVSSPLVAFDDAAEDGQGDRSPDSLPAPSMGRAPSVTSQQSVFCTYHGGVRSVDNGQPGNVVFFLGIIDILQRYNLRKRAEHSWKALKYDKNTISAVSPTVYCNRFLEFVKRAATLP